MALSCRQRIICFVMVFLCFTSPIGAGYVSDYKEAMRAFQGEEWERAESYFRRAIKGHDQEGEVIRLYGVNMEPYLPYFHLGIVLYELGREHEALEAWKISEQQQAVQETPHHKTLKRYRRLVEERMAAKEPSVQETESAAGADSPVERSEVDVLYGEALRLLAEKECSLMAISNLEYVLKNGMFKAPTRGSGVETSLHLKLAEAYVGCKDLAQAGKYLALAREHGASDEEVGNLVARLESTAKRPVTVPEVHSSSGTGQLVDLSLSESYALVVGASNYRGAWPALPGVLEDIEVVRDALARHGFIVQVLRDPTKDQLVDAMEDFFLTSMKTESSRLLFYYAGHGYTLGEGEDQRGYIVPVDAPDPKKELIPRRFTRKAIPMTRFSEYARESRAGHVMFLFDSCFSGIILKAARRSAGASGSVKEKIKGGSRIYIAAGDEDQEVPDISYFRQAFIEALEGEADSNGDGVIFGIELGQYIYDEVVNRFHHAKNPQRPRWSPGGTKFKGDFPFQSPVGIR